MIRILFFLLTVLTFVVPAMAQTQYAYRIRFTDKDNSPFSITSPQDFLSDRSIERREKYNIALTSQDLPVNQAYIDSVLEVTEGVFHNASRWLNQCTILVSAESDVTALSSIDFVAEVKKVGTYAGGLHNKPTDGTDETPIDMDSGFYAAAWKQIHLCKGETLHEHGYMGAGILIAVIDIGFLNVNTIDDFDSLFQNGRVVDTFNFKVNTPDVFSDGTHGTGVLSCMAAYNPNVFVGTAPKASYALYGTDDASTENSLELDNWIAAAERADSIGADVISTSVGYNTFDDDENSYTYDDMDGHTTLVARVANMASSRGILVVASAGNEGANAWEYILTPGDADSALTVGSVNYNRMIANSSGYGPNASGAIKPNVCAMGVSTGIINSSGNTTSISGTSVATPVLAGLAACLLQVKPNLKPHQVIQLIESVSDRYTNPDDHYGYGIPDFSAAYLTLGTDDAGISANSFLIYPNPASNEVRIAYAGNRTQQVQIDVLDVSGKRLLSRKWTTSTPVLSLDTSVLASGVYVVKIITPEKAESRRLIIN